MVKKLICIKHAEDCYALQEAVSKILSHVISDVHQFAHSSVANLWRISCQLLQTGLLNIKQVALDMMTGLLPWTGLPSMPVLDQFVKCLCSLLELLVSLAEKLPRNGREKVMAVEPIVASCLEVLSSDFSVKTKVQSQHGASKVEQQVLYAFPSGHVNQFLLSLRRVLSIGGLQRFLTPELKRAVCQFVAHIYRCIPVSTGRTVPLTQSRIKDEINESLVSFIGTEQEQQFLVRCLCEAVNTERANRKTSFIVKPSDLGTERQSSTMEMESKPSTPKKRKTLTISHPVEKQEKLTAVSATMDRLLERFKELANSILHKANEVRPNLEEFICELEGIRVITEVIVHLCSHQNKNSSEMSGIKDLRSTLLCLRFDSNPNGSLPVLDISGVHSLVDTR